MRKVLFLILMFLSFSAYGLEIVRQKNTATIIVFPIIDADGDIATGATGLDSELDTWADGAAPNGFADCTNEATEIGSTGIYYLSLSQSEMNNDYIYIQIKTSTVGAKTQHILIRTMTGAPASILTDKTGYSLGSSQTFNLTGNITGNLSGSVGSVTSGVTVTTNNDKTGYTLSEAGFVSDITAIKTKVDALNP